MARIERLSQFYADDKDIRDLLLDKAQVMTAGRLLEIARARGVFLSDAKEDSFSRAEMIDYVSRLPFSWPELSKLLEFAQTKPRIPRTTAERVHTDASVDLIERAAKRIEKLHNEDGQETLSVTRSEDRVHVSIRYSEMVAGNTRLLQRIPHDVMVDIERVVKPDGTFALVCRHENGVAKKVAEEILTALAETLPDPPPRTVIDLGGILDPVLRSRFFLDLMSSIAGYGRIHDVPDIGIYRVETDPDALADGRGGGHDPADDEDEEDAETRAERKKIQAVAKAVHFQGADLLQTEEFKTLMGKGFFIGRAVWLLDNDRGEQHRVEIEARLKDHKRGRDFGYKVRGIFSQKGQEIAKSKKKAGIADQRAIERAIEEAATAAFRGVLQEVTDAGAKDIDEEGVDK